MGAAATPKVILHRLRGAKKAQEACALIAGLYAGGRQVAVWVADPGRAAILDAYLWTFSQSAFIPHARWDGAGDVEDPVVIVSGRFAPPPGCDTLVVVDRLPELDGLGGFAAVHDLDAGGAEDQGKEAAWAAAGYEVVVDAPSSTRTAGRRES